MKAVRSLSCIGLTLGSILYDVAHLLMLLDLQSEVSFL